MFRWSRDKVECLALSLGVVRVADVREGSVAKY